MVTDRTKSTSSAGVASAERRRHSRFAFSAAAEVVEIGSSARIQGRISDLARGGCYVDVISPFAVGSEVTIRIVVDSRTLTAEARVVFAAPGMGDRKSTRLNSSHLVISYAVFCLKKKKIRMPFLVDHMP